MKNHLQHAFHLNDIARVATATKKKNTTLSVQSRPFSSTLYLVVKTTLSGPRTLLTLIRQLLGTLYGPYHKPNDAYPDLTVHLR
jgi:hypothetical protein